MAQGPSLGWSFSWRSLIAGELVFVAVGRAFDRAVFGPMESWVRHRWGLSSA